MRQIELNEIPGTSALFRDYITRKPGTLKLYEHDPFDPASLKKQAGALEGRDYDREHLAEVLTDQNSSWGADLRTLKNCGRLKETNCLAVVTGQQVGLLGGPLFTLVKAIHAVRLAEFCERELGRPVVPIFWLELEDHDLDEVNRMTIKDKEHQLHTLRLQIEGSRGRRPVKDIALGADIERMMKEVEELLPKTEFSDGLFEQLRECYQPDVGFGASFARLLTMWLTGSGLVLADPSHHYFKQRASIIFKQEIESPSTGGRRFLQHTEKITTGGYQPQVEIRPQTLQLFLKIENEKYRLATENGLFKLVGSDRQLSKQDLMEIVRQEPERLVPAVLLRPIVQDTLFPTLAYIGGPAETAYFAQITPLYREFGIPMPLIMPRFGITIVGAASRRSIEKYDIEISDLLKPAEALISHILAEHIPAHAEPLFQKTSQGIGLAMKKMQAELDVRDEGFKQAVETAAKKIQYQLDKLEQKYKRALEQKNEVLVNRLTRLSNSLYPDGALQERTFPTAQFINTYGSGLLMIIYDALDPITPTHRFIEV